MKEISFARRLSRIGVAAAAVLLVGTMGLRGSGNPSASLQAFREAFPLASRAIVISPANRPAGAPVVMEMRNGELLLGYGVDLKVTSRSGPFRLLVAVSPEETVMSIHVPDYPHRRGRAVRQQTFLDQFKGAAYGKPLRLGEEVDGVSGATSSATAVTGGVRQALILAHRYRKEADE